MDGFSNIEGASVLITGGAGFIGSHLIDALLEAGCKVKAMDNFATGRMENLQKFTEKTRFELQIGDIRNMDDCQKAADGVDYVLHEAALGSVPRSMKAPHTTWEINAGGFLNMLEAARQSGVKRFVYASSSSVYGDNDHVPKSEELTGNALSPYALSKQSNERAAAMYSRVFGMETIGLRYFNVFGPRQSPAGAYAAVIPRFAEYLVRHQCPVINGDGSFSRDFTYVDNVVQANLLALATTDPDAINQVYNIAGGERTTLNDLFALLRGELSVFDPGIAKVEVRHGAIRPGDIPHSMACIDKAKRLLGYAPEHDVHDGIKLAAKWYFENLK